MIRTEAEYKRALREKDEQAKRLKAHRKKLVEAGLSREELKRAMEPLISFHQQLVEELQIYESLKSGNLGEVSKLDGMGQQLVGLRIALGLSQRELAEKLGVHESQVSRDERNEYHGITLERANRILEALGVRLKTSYASISA